MKKTFFFSLILALSYFNNSLGMLLTKRTSCIRIKPVQQRIRSFHMSKVTSNHFEERIWIEDQHEQYLLTSPEFRKKVENQQLRRIEDALKENIALSCVIIEQNHLLFEISKFETNDNWIDGNRRHQLKNLYRKNNINLPVQYTGKE